MRLARSRRFAIVGFAALSLFVLVTNLLNRYKTGSVAEPVPEDVLYAECTEVVDGDTIIVRGLGSVRLIGIDTPEMNYELRIPEPLAEEAKKLCEELVRGKRVKLEFDEVKRDKYGRALGYVFVGDKFVNAELVRAGVARSYHILPNKKYRSLFRQLERQAQAEGLGLWRHPE